MAAPLITQQKLEERLDELMKRFTVGRKVSDLSDGYSDSIHYQEPNRDKTSTIITTTYSFKLDKAQGDLINAAIALASAVASYRVHEWNMKYYPAYPCVETKDNKEHLEKVWLGIVLGEITSEEQILTEHPGFQWFKEDYEERKQRDEEYIKEHIRPREHNQKIEIKFYSSDSVNITTSLMSIWSPWDDENIINKPKAKVLPNNSSQRYKPVANSEERSTYRRGYSNPSDSADKKWTRLKREEFLRNIWNKVKVVSKLIMTFCLNITEHIIKAIKSFIAY